MPAKPAPASSPAEIVEALQDTVEIFNESFQRWTDDHGCVASFVWKYAELDGQPIKVMELQSAIRLELGQVDKILYRRDAPTDAVMERVMEEAKKAAAEKLTPDEFVVEGLKAPLARVDGLKLLLKIGISEVRITATECDDLATWLKSKAHHLRMVAFGT